MENYHDITRNTARDAVFVVLACINSVVKYSSKDVMHKYRELIEELITGL